MYFLYPNIVTKIKETLRRLNLKIIGPEPQALIQQQKRFYRTFCQKQNGKKIFFKCLLAKEKGIKERFLNEIGFAKVLEENPTHPLSWLLPKTYVFSLKKSFPYFIQEVLIGRAKESKNRFSIQEIKKIANFLKVIKNSPSKIFKFSPKKPFFDFLIYQKKINSFLKSILLKKNLEEKIYNFIKQNKGLFSKIKTALSHGDFSEANLFFLKNGEIKIIDWEHIHLRNPLYDFTEFWMKRRKHPKEQKILTKELLKNFYQKEYFFKLLKLALLEICLRDLSLFQKVIADLKKERKFQPIKQIEKEKKDYLKVIKNYILTNKEKIYTFKEIN